MRVEESLVLWTECKCNIELILVAVSGPEELQRCFELHRVKLTEDTSFGSSHTLAM